MTVIKGKTFAAKAAEPARPPEPAPARPAPPAVPAPARVPIAVLASGRGSNFEAIARAVRAGALGAEIVALVCDRPEAPALALARQCGIRAIACPAPGGSAADTPADTKDARRARHEEAILKELEPLQPRFLVLAGYMRVLGPRLLAAFRSPRGYCRVVNVHPSLLPAFPGVRSYAQAFDHGAKVAGVTVHLVESAVDSGPICAQEAFSIADCRSVGEVEARGLELEHRLYPKTLEWVLREKFEFTPPRRVIPAGDACQATEGVLPCSAE